LQGDEIHDQGEYHLTPEETKSTGDAGKNDQAKNDQARNRDEVALEMMKFIAVTTGYGKGNTTAAGFSGKPSKSAEEYADALIQLFEKCRAVVAKPVEGGK
jgi:ATP:corrinoid adenosyltransferase